MVFFLLQRTYDSGTLYSESEVLQQMKSGKARHWRRAEDATTQAGREYYD
jgi:hypothetical protein